MNLFYSVKWMFLGSLFIGIFLNGMNFLAYRLIHLYSSLTLFYSALLMASNMSILEILMHAGYYGHINWPALVFFVLLTIVIVCLLRQQFMVDDNQWLKRMISHHSTALTTSHKIKKRTENKSIQKLADDIIVTQEREIDLMERLIKKGGSLPP